MEDSLCILNLSLLQFLPSSVTKHALGTFDGSKTHLPAKYALFM
jgi:hypothetical protein